MKHLLLSLGCLWGPGGLAGVPQDPGDEDATRFFAVPLVRDTRELAAVAQEHLQAGRTWEAMSVLQRILEDHAGEVLPRQRAAGDPPSQFLTFHGAAEWALERLLELPEEARSEYRARYEPRAAAALERARFAPERTNLLAVARSWPLAPSAVRAWWTLGDLELEGGHLEAAGLAWQRAQAHAAELGLDTGPLEQRVEWLRTRPERRSGLPRPGSLPRGDAEAWTTPLDLTPFVQRGGQGGPRTLLPAAAGEVLLVGTTLRLYALDAFTGELRWQAGPPGGWAGLIATGADGELFQGIDHEQLLLAPAAGDGVALAVMQIPYTENDTEDWQGIEIMRAIPERRLYAFDLATGRERWNHAPPLSVEGLRPRWDGSGSYAQRMMVAGSPVVAGSRVLAPCYRMQGRIDYHVACYELETGDLLWNTPVISGQRERNMFGRSVKEFCASPLVVAGARVVAQTELGTVAALDLFTGRILWESTYRQIPLPKTRTYQPPERKLTWRLTPPVVVDGVIVATPSDSSDIAAFRLADGRVLWSYSEEQLQELDRGTELLSFNHLVGADQDTLYLSGLKLSALQKPGGLGSSSFLVPRWTTKPLERSETSPRAVLTADAVLVPNVLGRVAFDRRTGARLEALSGGWNRGDAGNLWIGDGALFSLSPLGLSGYFDWQALLERARVAAESAGDDVQVRAAAELFLRRGTLSLENGDLAEAQTVLEQARALLAGLRERTPRTDPAVELRCLRALAETAERSGRTDAALELTARARGLEPRGNELAALLFLEERLLRAEGGARRVAVLAELEAGFGALPLPEDMAAEVAAAWLAGTSGAETLASGGGSPLPIGLWVAVERAGERGRAGELALAFEDLHSALERSRGLALARGFPVAAAVRERTARLLALPGARAAYAGLEQRARALLDSARSTADPLALEAVAELFPHSRAAEEARGIVLERAVAAGDAAAVAAIVASSLESTALDRERETSLLLRLARVLGSQGNAAYERGLLAELARADPAAVSDLPGHEGRTLGALAAELAREPLAPAPAPVLFGPQVVGSGQARQGAFEFLGALPSAVSSQESQPHELHVYATRERLEAYSSRSPGSPTWTHELDPPLDDERASSVFAPGRLIYGTRAGLTCLDEQGTVRWTRDLDGEAPRRLAEWSGVLLVLQRSLRVLAFDSLLGHPLWERTLGEGGNWSGPLLGEGRAVFFSRLHGLPPRALVLDVFRGRTTADFRLIGFDSRADLEDTAWIEDERLVAPAFQQRPSHLSAFALADGRRAWTIGFGRDEELDAVARHAGRAYPVTLAASLGSTAGNGGVHELDPRTGTVRLVVPLRTGERVMGLESRRVVELDSPHLFTYTQAQGERGIPIRAIHLPYAIQWTWSLPVASQEVYDVRNLPMPAVSADCVAIAYQTRRTGGARGDEATIVFVDKRAGRKIEHVSLSGGFSSVRSLELRGLGEALFVLGKPGNRGCLEILEEMR